jgi:tripartite-type tricarboxylate transporter receptor subunit TctC
MARRTALLFAILLATVAGFAGAGQAQSDYPARPVKLVVPFAAGGPTDVVARILGDMLSARWGGQSIVIENRPGAGTIVATAAVANAPKDGYTFLIATNSLLINPAIGQKLPYDTLKDLAAVTMIATQPVALVANKSFAPNTVAELVALAKTSAEPINFTSPGPRGVGHFAGELLQQRAGIRLQHINYNGSAPALVDLIAGRVPIMFDIWHSAKRYVDTGQIKLIAGASAERLSDAPDTATIAESYPGFAVMAMNALYAPSGVPAPILAKASSDVREIVESAAFREKTKHLGILTWGTTPQELDTWTRSEIANWAKVAKAANIKVD